MYVVIQNHVQNTSLLLYVNVAFWMQFAIFLSFSLFLIATNMRRKRTTSTATNYTHRKESQLASVAEAGAIFFRSLEKFTSLALACFLLLLLPQIQFNSLISALLNLYV